MAVFVTGATGYLGSYIVQGLLRETSERLALLVRGQGLVDAQKRLWRALQLHMGFEEFWTLLNERIEVFTGDITEDRLGLGLRAYHRLVRATDSVIHVAASLNRRSELRCLNVNLRGTLAVAKLAHAALTHHGLRRFSEVSTTAVAGRRCGETVFEDSAIDWNRPDYDPYARSKKFCEHMVRELLSNAAITTFRPSIVLGDSKRAETTQFEMLRAFAFLARLPVIPVRKRARLDIVPADYVGRAIVTIHQQPRPAHEIYHVSAGCLSQTAEQIVSGLRLFGKPLRGRLADRLVAPTGRLSEVLAATPRSWGMSRDASLLKVFWPYITFDTVFDNRRVVDALGEAPPPCTSYMSPVLDFAVTQRFTYPYELWPADCQKEGLPSLP